MFGRVETRFYCSELPGAGLLHAHVESLHNALILACECSVYVIVCLSVCLSQQCRLYSCDLEINIVADDDSMYCCCAISQPGSMQFHCHRFHSYVALYEYNSIYD